MAGKKGQLNTIYENMGLPEVEIQRDLLPWSGKTLILGSSESGKSTLLKSLKLYMKGSYTLDERAAFKEIIFSNAVQSMRIVLEAMEALRMPLEHGQSEYRVQALDMLPAQVEMQQILDLVANAIEALYADLGDQDILRSRVKTTGILKTTFEIPGQKYFIYDVGGRRSERKNWKRCFEDAGAVLFTVDIASYDQLMCEHRMTNRMQENFMLFESMIKFRWASSPTFALLFTKYDKLAGKLKTSPMKNYFPDFQGDDDLEHATAYITNRFLSLSRTHNRHIEIHYTSIVDHPRRLGYTVMDFLQRVRFDGNVHVLTGKEF
ncbi:guanine nucleotide-binding protein subunit alpha [Xylographa carneopallida]|nr:guanine nucleotide-binding protein subunit alpha [Xylographa carneopallida]